MGVGTLSALCGERGDERREERGGEGRRGEERKARSNTHTHTYTQ